jgi:protein-tyrosine phosphatase
MSLAWVAVGQGRLTVRGRPSIRALPGLRDAGCSHVVTLLSEAEGAPALGEAVRAAGMGWLWVPLRNGTPPVGSDRARVALAFPEMQALLAGGSSLLVHCAAGIHRTGMIAYALLRWCGSDREEALARLGEMREHTRSGVAEKHLAWGDDLVRAPPVSRDPGATGGRSPP